MIRMIISMRPEILGWIRGNGAYGQYLQLSE
jgi:hypothetical protein